MDHEDLSPIEAPRAEDGRSFFARSLSMAMVGGEIGEYFALSRICPQATQVY